MHSHAKPVLSIIIPMYNVSEWLPDCLDSILSATEDIQGKVEITLFDDASTDRTKSIADAYANRFPGMIHVDGWTRNQGPGAARNKAYNEAAGRYCWFIDADDVLEQDAVSSALAHCRSDIDILYLGTIRLRGKKSRKERNTREIDAFIKDYGAETILNCDSRERLMLLPFSPWRYLFRRGLISDQPFCATYYTEDLYFHLKLAARATSIQFLPDVKVLYRRRRGQLTGRRSRAVRTVHDTFIHILNDLVCDSGSDLIWRVFLLRYLSKLRHLCRTQPTALSLRFRREVRQFWRKIPEERIRSHMASSRLFYRLEYISMRYGLFPEVILFCWFGRLGIRFFRVICSGMPLGPSPP